MILELLAQKVSHSKIAKKLGVAKSTVSKYSKRPLQDTSSPVSEILGDTWKINLPKTPVKNLAELVAAQKIDTTIWEVERFIVSKFDSTEHQVKAVLKKKRAVLAAQEELVALKARAKESARKPSFTFQSKVLSGNLLEINIPDLHAGKLAWGHETGGPNYDTKLACDLFNTALESLLDRVKGHKFDKVLFVIGNDLLNADDIEGRTTKGTHVSTDTRYHKTFAAVREMKIQAIERLRRVAKEVVVLTIPGNHDTHSVWHLGDSLECYFHNYKDVVIENSPRNRKYYQFGKVMLMFTHGEKGKRSDYPLLMATEQPEMFGATRFREAHTGHNHVLSVNEQHGVRVRILSALCPADDYHAENGFTGNIRSAEAFVWNQNEGLIGTAIYSA